MTKIAFRTALALIVSLSLLSPVHADGWWPFSSTSKSSKTINASSRESSWPRLSMPKMPTFMKKTQKSTSSTFSKMGRTTKNWWHNTIDVLSHPYGDSSPKVEDRSAYGTFSDSKKKPKESWMSGLWKSEAKSEPKTVGEWMDLSRPQ